VEGKKREGHHGKLYVFYLLIDLVLKIFSCIEDWKFVGSLSYNPLFFPNIS